MKKTDGVQEVAAMDDVVLDQGMQASPLVATTLARDLAVFLAPLCS